MAQPLSALPLLLILLISGAVAAAPPPEVPSRGSDLDPRQLTALQSLGFPTSRDPCAVPSPRDNATACDNSAPFRHLVSLRFANCSPDLDLPTTALRAISTLRSLSFLRCPVSAPRHLPVSLASSLRSFSCDTSLRRLTGVWLSRLQNLTDLSVVGVPISTSGPAVLLSQMRRLRSVTIARTNLSGGVPRHWHALDLVYLNFSSNCLKGRIPSSISALGFLQNLDLSSNALSGTLPDSIGDLADLKNATFAHNSLSGPIPDSISQLSSLTHLDLSSNQFNGSIPKFVAEMKQLKFLNLEKNNFQGVFPFNATFLRKLDVFKVGGNANLCYNRTQLPSKLKLKLGIAPCDKYGQPVSPPPDRSSRADSDYADDGSDEESGDNVGDGGGNHHGPSKLVLGVAIALSCFVFLVIFLVCLSKICR